MRQLHAVIMIELVDWTEELGPGAPVLGRVYGYRELSNGEFRYVGQTTKTIRRRVQEHRQAARRGRKTPFYDWLRMREDNEFEVVSLEGITTSRGDLGEAEIAWITVFRAAGDRLLNLSEGGLGPTGVTWTEERREIMRQMNLGRNGVSRPGELNPMWGKQHSAAQRAVWSALRKGSILGEKNPNFGKFGPAHPSYDHKVSEEARAELSAQKMGELNPNFGKKASEETRAKMSAVRKGRPMPSSIRNAHTRHHTNKGVFKELCRHCLEDAKQIQSSEHQGER